MKASRYPPTCLSIRLPFTIVCLHVCFPAYLLVHLSVYLPTSARLSIYLLICL